MRKTSTFRVNDYYDGGVVRLEQVRVPSKRVGYTDENGILVARIPSGARDFEAAIREAFVGTMPRWPLSGRLLLGVGINLPKSDYRVVDIDNMTKAIVDAFKGVAYTDDCQIDCLFASKSIAQQWSTWVAFRSLGDDQKSWLLEPVFIRVENAA